MQDIVNYYSSFDEWGRLEREPLEFLVNWHFIKKHLPESGQILDNGAGPGRPGYLTIRIPEGSPGLIFTKLKTSDRSWSRMGLRHWSYCRQTALVPD
ncbi:hypothetical protein [Paenibacillus alkalitolerans]|uniref:hypothetical protein n=1 Tax=Paenibacillus alkalitolerans TaxID=2799335 RepID=UPI002D7ECE2F|nr:hypothetical protein [Paenibacillus alkalitolerans]